VPNIPPELRAHYGNGDDATLGKGAYEGMNRRNNGDLAKMNQDGGAVVGAINVLGDPHASVEAVAGAIATLAGLAVAAAGTEVGVAVLGVTIAAAVPIVGWAVIAFLAVVLIIYEILPHASGALPAEYTPQQKFDFAVASIPPDFSAPRGTADPSLDAIKIMTLVAQIVSEEAKGAAVPDLHHMLSQAFGNRAGFAADVYGTVADVVHDPRWHMGSPSPWLLAETQQNQPRPDGSPGFDVGSTFAEAAAMFAGRNIPHYLPYELVRAPDGQMYPKIGADGGPGLLDVSRYLVIFSVLYHMANPDQARAATYAAVYQIQIQKAWQYTAAGLTVPYEIYASMGFLLDLISRYPLLRIEQSQQTVQQALMGGARATTTVFHDVAWHVNHYLAQDIRFAPQSPGVFTPPTGAIQGGGAQQAPPPPVVQVAVPISPGGFSGGPVFRR
jgi:hypothetical protein